MIAPCEVDGCEGTASVHVLHPMRRVCSACAVEVRFPRAQMVLQCVALAETFRAAAADLDELAGAAHSYELGTLRRKMRGIVLGALGLAGEGEGEGS